MKKKSKKKGLFEALFLTLNLLVMLPLFCAFFAQMLPPTSLALCSLCGLFFPYLLYANLFFVVFWLFVKYKFVLISLCVILLNINNIDRHFQFKPTAVPEPCVNCVKVMSYNVKLFGVYDDDSEPKTGAKKQKILNFLKEEQPDIVCFQEYFYENSKRINFPTTDTILPILKLDNDPKYYYQYFPQKLKNEYFYGLAVFSRYRIVRAEPVPMPEFSSNAAVFIDIRFKRDTIRIYNVHLASIHMDRADYETSRKFSNQESDSNFNENAKHIYDKLAQAFVNRKMQVDSLRAHMDACPYPIILCGDFNDTPASYSYNRLAKKLKDTFRKSGSGMGTTYNGDAIPAYRIDYILHDSEYRSYGHKVVRKVDVSDHFPIVSHISLQKSDL